MPWTEPTSASTASYMGIMYPDSSCRHIATSRFKQGSVLHFLVCPFLYDAADKNLYFISSIKLRITLNTPEFGTLSYNHPMCNLNMDMVKSMIINSADSFDIAPVNPRQDSDIDYIIITNRELAPSFKELAMWKTQKGIRTEIKTVEDIYETYCEPTPQLKIKRCLYDYYQNHNLKYALLGGDDTIVPVQLVKGISTLNEFIPADNFYSCFDSCFNWDKNDNGIAGEFISGNNSDGVDFLQCISLSRLPVRSVSDVMNFLKKLLRYEMDPLSAQWNNSILFSGHVLITVHDGRSDAQIKGMHMYETYIKPYWDGKCVNFFDTHTDIANGNYKLNKVHMEEQLSKGYSFVDIITHGSPKSWRLGPSPYPDSLMYHYGNAGSVISSGFTVILTIACLTNAFDDKDTDPCLSEAFIRNPDSGVVAYFGSSRNGWIGEIDSIWPSLLYESYFYKYLFSKSSSNFATLSNLTKYALIQNTYSEKHYNYLQFGLNPVGDPEMQLFTSTPKVLGHDVISFSQDTLFVDAGEPDCRICVSNLHIDGGTLFDVRENIQTATFNNLPQQFSICITKPG
ncbi:MAG: C25 family cysteine peptidase [Firmicutes bacterium]|nr:C25 family cysteine peptidase [Bacillota bacterium]MCM1400588.1 C25 family cysteine peptidase [Bacteroides sp.]MCM1477485.1 C25 family cysteine peptidase [Bacteroides sp.]